MKELELRMYFFVPYNISEIQKGIQAGHAAVEYSILHKDNELFEDFVNYYKTWIILNGGTTREDTLNPGTIQQIYYDLYTYNLNNPTDQIDIAKFNEPDLNNTMSSVCFICDQRVWDYEECPNYEDSDSLKKYDLMNFDDIEVSKKEWQKMMGGKKNVFLRELLKGKKLA